MVIRPAQHHLPCMCMHCRAPKTSARYMVHALSMKFLRHLSCGALYVAVLPCPPSYPEGASRSSCQVAEPATVQAENETPLLRVTSAEEELGLLSTAAPWDHEHAARGGGGNACNLPFERNQTYGVSCGVAWGPPRDAVPLGSFPAAAGT